MNKDTSRPEGHHGRNNPPQPTIQSYKGVPADPDEDIIDDDELTEADRDFIAALRNMKRDGFDVHISAEDD